jgi:hypothetical protein
MRVGWVIEAKAHCEVTTQCIYSSVSKASLQKTGVLLNSAGDFWEFSPEKVRKWRNWRLLTIRKARHWRAFLPLKKKIL